jgi:two-component system, NtrC family, sensor kinase
VAEGRALSRAAALLKGRSQSADSHSMTHAPGSGERPVAPSGGESPADVLMDPRVLVIDDNEAIHEDVRKILHFGQTGVTELSALEADLFDETPTTPSWVQFQIDSAYQGQEGFELVKAALAEGRPYAVAFVDVRMPPGWDGIETIGHIWRADPDIQIVICTAFSDHSWPEIVAKLAPADGLLILRKPFDGIEIRQMVHALSAKWMLNRELHLRLADLERSVQVRTADLVNANENLRKEILTRARLESELVLAQKLETVGQMAANLAHGGHAVTDVSENLQMLRLAFEDLTNLIGTYRRLLLNVTTVPGQAHLLKRMEEADEAANLLSLQRDIPRAFERLVSGTSPMSDLVHAVKEVVREETGEHSTKGLAVGGHR